MGPKKWLKQAGFMLFGEKIVCVCVCEELIQQSNLGFECPISEESKQNVDLG